MLITGTASGLGRFLFENLGGQGITRANCHGEIEEAKRSGTDVIIHCAFNMARTVAADALHSYLYDNVFLTKELTSVKHQKFILLSSVDVYPKNGALHSEDEPLNADPAQGLYGLTKLMSEAIVKECCANHLILRPTALLGKYSRKNSLIKILEGKDCCLTLSGKSRFNYVLHSDLLAFIKLAIQKDLKGVYNVASSGNVKLSEVAAEENKRVTFGNYDYDAGDIDNRKIVSIFPDLGKTSSEAIRQFQKERE